MQGVGSAERNCGDTEATDGTSVQLSESEVTERFLVSDVFQQLHTLYLCHSEQRAATPTALRRGVSVNHEGVYQLPRKHRKQNTLHQKQHSHFCLHFQFTSKA